MRRGLQRPSELTSSFHSRPLTDYTYLSGDTKGLIHIFAPFRWLTPVNFNVENQWSFPLKFSWEPQTRWGCQKWLSGDKRRNQTAQTDHGPTQQMWSIRNSQKRALGAIITHLCVSVDDNQSRILMTWHKEKPVVFSPCADQFDNLHGDIPWSPSTDRSFASPLFPVLHKSGATSSALSGTQKSVPGTSPDHQCAALKS